MCCFAILPLLDDQVLQPITPSSKVRNNKQRSPELHLRMGAEPYVPRLARIPRNPQALRSAFAPQAAVDLAGDSAMGDKYTSLDALSQAVIHRREVDWDPPRCIRDAIQRTLIPNPSGRLMLTQIPDLPGPQVILQTFNNLRTHRALVMICEICAPSHTVCEYPLGMSLRAFVFGISLERTHPWANTVSNLLSFTCTADCRPVACSQPLPTDVDIVHIHPSTSVGAEATMTLQDTIPIPGLPPGPSEVEGFAPGGPRPPVPPIPPLGRRWGFSSFQGILDTATTISISPHTELPQQHGVRASFNAAEGTFVLFDELLHMRILEMPVGATAHQLVELAYAETAQLPFPRGHRFLHHAVPGLPPVQLCVWGQLDIADIVLPFLTQRRSRNMHYSCCKGQLTVRGGARIRDSVWVRTVFAPRASAQADTSCCQRTAPGTPPPLGLPG